MSVRRLLPTGLTLVVLSVVVGLLQEVWDWSNAATNLAALAVLIVVMAVFARTAVAEPPPDRRA
jgi:hypothetical protein